MTSLPSARALAVLGVILVSAGGPGSAAAQSEWLGGSCRSLTRCPESGAPCPAGTHRQTLPDDLCVCASGGDDTLGEPIFCCDEGSCPTSGSGGATCINVDGSVADLCLTPEIDLCLTDGATVIDFEAAAACFTRPGTTTLQSYWRAGDCDGDGITNGIELLTERDPCCNEDTDLSCCLTAFDDPAACCAATDPSDPIGCCFSNDGAPALCCAGHDPVLCCQGASDPQACCREAASDDAACCELAENPAACCLDSGGASNVCCVLAGASTVDGCGDAAVGDAAVGNDAAITADAGSEPGDAGPMDGAIASDGGNLGFGGGGGCHCSARGARAPSALGWLAIALALAIPAFRRR